jgi:single-stranded DNA-binding protein
MNVFTVTGRLGRDAQSKTPQSGGDSFIVFSIAEDQFFKKQEVTVWYEVIANETKKLKSMLPYLKKGSSVVVTGFQHVSLDEYNGEKKIRITIYADRVEFNSNGKNDSSNNEPAPKTETKTESKKDDEEITVTKKTVKKEEPAPEPDNDVDDDLPF